MICLGVKLGKDPFMNAKRMVANGSAFIPQLKSYDPSKVTAKMIAALKPYAEDPELDADKAARSSKAVQGLSLWIHAVYGFGMQRGLGA